MLAVAIRGLAARKLRSALTALAVVLGVGLISGTYILTDTINQSFDNLFATVSKGIDVSITPRDTVGEQQAFSAAYLRAVERTPGVKAASGGVFNQGTILDAKGKTISTGGAPQFIASVQPRPFTPFSYPKGHPPRTASEVALDESTISKAGYKLGDRVRLAGEAPQRSYVLVGAATFGDSSTLGSNIAILTLPEAQRMLGEVGRFDSINVAATPDTTPEQLVARLRGELPRSLAVRTGEQNAAEQSKSIKDNLSFLNTILLVFAGIALFVGAFMIFNAFSITIAQRSREFAMLRTIGASRGQVLRSVIAEALALGFTASLLGLLAGIGLAPALKALFTLFGASLPAEGTVIEMRTVVVSLVVGTLVTLLASLGPAIRATRVSPIAALQDSLSPARRRRQWLRTTVAVLVLLLGVALLAGGLFGGAGGGAAAGIVGLGAAIVFIGVAMLSRYFVRPLASLVGIPIERLTNVTGRLARENSVRNTGRTASTAAALMIGVALVTFVTIFADGIKASVVDSVNDAFRGAFVLQSSSGGPQPIPAGAADAARAVPGVETVVQTRSEDGKVRGQSATVNFTGTDTRVLPRVYQLDWKQGDDATLTGLGPRDAIISQQYHDDHKVDVGDALVVTTPTDAVLRFRVRGVYKDDAGLLGNVTITNAALTAGFGERRDVAVLVGIAPGADEARVQAALKRVVDARFPQVEVRTKQQFTDQVASQINQLTTFFYVLLSLAVIVSLFGIVNTLALSIYERTRELGLLRAIGTSRAQVRRIVRYEAVIVSMIGGVTGIVLGVLFALAVTPALADEGLKISIPVGTLIVLLVLAGLAGVLAAILPARRAARLDVLEALAYE